MPTARQPSALRKRIHSIIEVGAPDDYVSRAYDFINMLSIVVNLVCSVAYTFVAARERYGPLLLTIESITVAFFAIDFLLRLITARCHYPRTTELKSIRAYLFSTSGLLDLFSFLPYYLPFFFPAGTVAFRMFRVVRIFRLFRINAYYDSLNVITEVISSKKQQLLSSVFIILILMLASSLCMYSLEHDAQPTVFTNAFSGMWWSVSTLLTVGYGDIYPITDVGKIFSIIITFLGVGMVAIPTGIISAGFVDQYSRIKRISEYAQEEDVHFIKIHLTGHDKWCGHTIVDLHFPDGMLVAAIQRDGKIVAPRGGTRLQPGDVLVLGAETFDHEEHIDLREVILRKQHEWNGQMIRDLDISRHTVIVMVKRQNRMLIPKGSLMLQEGDKVVLYTQKHIGHSASYSI